MPLPSYARTTASSTLKTTRIPTQHQVSSNDPPTTKSTPKKPPKRPSTVTSNQRQRQIYKSDLYPIQPQDPNKPCPLASLPSELRTTIYHHILSASPSHPQPHSILNPRTQKQHFIWPNVLHISRAVRIEAAYIYYTTTPFHFRITNLNFAHVIQWLGDLPPRHRALLSRNRHLGIEMNPVLRPTHTYPPPDWLLDAPLHQHWKTCAPFGNLYGVGAARRVEFVLFCRLVAWFQGNNGKMCRGVRWRYEFDTAGTRYSWVARGSEAETLVEFLRDQVSVLRRGAVCKAWTRGRVVGRGREEVRVFLGDLNDVFGTVNRQESENLLNQWQCMMRDVRKVVEKW